MLRQPVIDPPHPAQRGLAKLVLALRDGKTRLTQCRTESPLVVQRAHYLDESLPEMAFIYLVNPTGGFLQYDQHRVCITACTGAQAHITTQNATKLYAMPDGSARQEVQLTVEAGGYLEYLPDPIIPFAAANFEQSTCVDVAPGGTLLHWEVITPGRVAMEERFRYARLCSRLTVNGQHGHPVYREAFDLTPTTRNPLGIAVLGSGADYAPGLVSAPTLGSMLCVTDAPRVRTILEQLQELLQARADVQGGASTLPDGNGLGVKVIGPDAAIVQTVLAECWSVCRRQILGVGAPFLRKY